MITPDELNAIQERCEKATEGPWAKVKAYDKPKLRYFVAECSKAIGIADLDGTYPNESDADFIAHARSDLPRLIAEVRRLTRVIVRELTENDELGTEYSYVIALKEETARLREALEHFKLGHEHNETNPNYRPLGDTYGWCSICDEKVSLNEDIARAALEKITK